MAAAALAQAAVEKEAAGTYVGERSKAGAREGHGASTYPDGSVYEGEYMADVKHGRGAFLYPGGAADLVMFRDGSQEGDGVTWAADRQRAWLLRDGTSQGEFSLDEARAVTARVGLPVPPPVLTRVYQEHSVNLHNSKTLS